MYSAWWAAPSPFGTNCLHIKLITTSVYERLAKRVSRRQFPRALVAGWIGVVACFELKLAILVVQTIGRVHLLVSDSPQGNFAFGACCRAYHWLYILENVFF